MPFNLLNALRARTGRILRENGLIFNEADAGYLADLDNPILLNEDGEIIDGRHRLCKALLHNEKTIKARRFDKDPADCFEWV